MTLKFGAVVIGLFSVMQSFAGVAQVVCQVQESVIDARGRRARETFTTNREWDASKKLNLEVLSRIEPGLKYVASYDPERASYGLGVMAFYLNERTLFTASAATNAPVDRRARLSFFKDELTTEFACSVSEE